MTLSLPVPSWLWSSLVPKDNIWGCGTGTMNSTVQMQVSYSRGKRGYSMKLSTMLLPEEMVISLLLGSLIFLTHFLIILLYPLLLPISNLNWVSFTLINCNFFIFVSTVLYLGHLLVQLFAALCPVYTLFFLSLSFTVIVCVTNKFDLMIWNCIKAM